MHRVVSGVDEAASRLGIAAHRTVDGRIAGRARDEGILSGLASPVDATLDSESTLGLKLFESRADLRRHHSDVCSSRDESANLVGGDHATTNNETGLVDEIQNDGKPNLRHRLILFEADRRTDHPRHHSDIGGLVGKDKTSCTPVVLVVVDGHG